MLTDAQYHQSDGVGISRGIDIKICDSSVTTLPSIACSLRLVVMIYFNPVSQASMLDYV
jgi:hypothetical protein